MAAGVITWFSTSTAPRRTYSDSSLSASSRWGTALTSAIWTSASIAALCTIMSWSRSRVHSEGIASTAWILTMPRTASMRTAAFSSRTSLPSPAAAARLACLAMSLAMCMRIHHSGCVDSSRALWRSRPSGTLSSRRNALFLASLPRSGSTLSSVLGWRFVCCESRISSSRARDTLSSA